MPESFEYRHVVSLEESNALGNVYFTHYLSWQGRCRELFLREYGRDSLPTAAQDVVVTTRCSCEYLAELEPFDEVAVRMRLGQAVQNRLLLL